MWPYPWTHVGTPSHLGHMDRVAATMPSQAHAGAAQEAPDIGQWEGQLAQLALHNPHIWANSLKPVCFLCFLLFWCPFATFH